MTTAAENRLAFVAWLRANHPALYAQVLRDTSPGALGNLFDSAGNLWDKLVTGATALAGQYVKSKADLELLKANIQRARAGSPPVTANGTPIAPPSAPTATIPAPVVAAAVQGPSIGGMPQWMLYAGLALAAYLILRRR